MPHFRSFAALCASVVLSCACFAQQVMLSRIEFTGDSVHSPQELLAASGLKPGISTQQAVQDAAQRLNDTGLFDEVNFSSDGATLTYTLKPAAPSALLPVTFANFPWWSDAELDAALRKQVPLYRQDQVPQNGTVVDAVTAALQSMVAAKGVTSPTVTSHLVSTHPGAPPDAVAFQITSPIVRVRSFKLEGASSAMQPKLQQPTAELLGERWDQIAFPGLIDSRIGAAYRDNGYLDVTIDHLQHSAPDYTTDGINLDLTATVTEGPQYRVSQIAWAGSPALSPADFSHAAELHPGDIASALALSLTLHAVEVAYSAQGYLQARVTAPPQFDRAAHTVAYNIAVHPGPQYHLKAITWSGLTQQQIEKIQSRWKLKAGDIYDATYPLSFIQQNSTLVPIGTRPGVEVHANSDDHTVVLTMIFSRTG